MESFFKLINKNLFLLILLSISSGILFVKIFGGFEFSVLICVFAALTMIYPSLISLDFNKIKEITKYKKTILISVLLNFIIIPVIGFIIGYIFLRNDTSLFLGLFLLSILPGGGMVVSWAQKTKSDLIATVGIIVSNLMVAVIIVPIFLSLFINNIVINKQFIKTSEPLTRNFYQEIVNKDKSIDPGCVVSKTTNNLFSCGDRNSSSINPITIVIPIVVIIITPLLLAYFTQKSLVKKLGTENFEKSKKIFLGISNIGMFLTLFFLMGMKQNIIIFEHPDLLLKSIIPIVLFYFIIFIINLLIYKKSKTEETKALIWGNYLRYITLALGFSTSLIYQNQEYSQMIIIIVLSYLIQIPLSFLLSKILNKNK